MQYLQPAERLATCEISRFSLRSTLLSGAPDRSRHLREGRVSFGSRCMISMEFGTKPMRFCVASNCAFQVRRGFGRQRRQAR